MRWSCLLFKKLTFPNPLLFALLSSCYSMHIIKESAPPAPPDTFAKIRLIDRHGIVAAIVPTLSCHHLQPLRLQVKLHSAAPVFTPTLVIHPDDSRYIEIDGHVIRASPQPIYMQLRQAMCHSITRRGHLFYAKADEPLLDILSEWLQLLSPCQISYRSAQGFYCKLNNVAKRSQQRQLQQIKRRMVTRWQRQPYLLMRRLAITLDLARIVTAADFDQLPRFCHILQGSYPQELPLIFTSNRWQQSVCNAKDSSTSAALGLELALREIKLFQQLFERASHRGNIALRISAPMQHRFWVMLTPTTTTLTTTMQQYQQLLAAQPPPAAATHHWHPFFAENTQLNNLARALGLHIGNAAMHFYPATRLHDTNNIFGNYLVTSITSETEFIVSNGRTKFLRLPSGDYDYRVAHLPNYYLPNTNAEVARGSLRWHNRYRNYQVIR